MKSQYPVPYQVCATVKRRCLWMLLLSSMRRSSLGELHGDRVVGDNMGDIVDGDLRALGWRGRSCCNRFSLRMRTRSSFKPTWSRGGAASAGPPTCPGCLPAEPFSERVKCHFLLFVSVKNNVVKLGSSQRDTSGLQVIPPLKSRYSFLWQNPASAPARFERLRSPCICRVWKRMSEGGREGGSVLCAHGKEEIHPSVYQHTTLRTLYAGYWINRPLPAAGEGRPL